MFGNLYEVYSVSAAHCRVFDERTFVFQCPLLSPCFRLLFFFWSANASPSVSGSAAEDGRHQILPKDFQSQQSLYFFASLFTYLFHFQVGDADNMHTEGEQKFCISHILKNIKARHLSLLSLPFRQHL
jgi:hypothetical protein